MKNLFQPITVRSIVERIEKLQPTSQRLWGRMNVAQMLAHCTVALEVATGKHNPPRMLVGRIFGRFAKPLFVNEKPLRKNTPTEPSFIIKEERDFDTERKRLLDIIGEFSSGGEAKVTKHPHSFFGKLTADEWSRGMYKHLDHHLKQFGV